MCKIEGGRGERSVVEEPGGVWRSTLAYQILLAARQIVARRQITQGGGVVERLASHPQSAVALPA